MPKPTLSQPSPDRQGDCYTEIRLPRMGVKRSHASLRIRAKELADAQDRVIATTLALYKAIKAVATEFPSLPKFDAWLKKHDPETWQLVRDQLSLVYVEATSDGR